MIILNAIQLQVDKMVNLFYLEPTTSDAIAGITIGCLAGVLVVVVIVYLVYKRPKKPNIQATYTASSGSSRATRLIEEPEVKIAYISQQRGANVSNASMMTANS